MLIIEFIDEDNNTHIEPFLGMIHEGEDSYINDCLVTAEEYARVASRLRETLVDNFQWPIVLIQKG